MERALCHNEPTPPATSQTPRPSGDGHPPQGSSDICWSASGASLPRVRCFQPRAGRRAGRGKRFWREQRRSHCLGARQRTGKGGETTKIIVFPHKNVIAPPARIQTRLCLHVAETLPEPGLWWQSFSLTTVEKKTVDHPLCVPITRELVRFGNDGVRRRTLPPRWNALARGSTLFHWPRCSVTHDSVEQIGETRKKGSLGCQLSFSGRNDRNHKKEKKKGKPVPIPVKKTKPSQLR